ncbi:hypothetical protein cypCar_00018153 [Cyprinus carpio]|nr:hypothetical protein cypCar_00018153 [Cyprinus carpio]
MINTFHTSYNPPPPPVPPRAGYSRPRPAGNTSLVKFLSVMLLLLMILTFGGFLYLFQKLNMVSQANEKLSKLTGGQHFIGPAAHMTVQTEHKDKTDKTSDFLKKSLLWDEEHSLLQDVRLSKERDKLTIQYPGIYFIYSQVTFSKNSPVSSLKQSIRITVPKKEQDKELLKSFCSLKPNTSNLCTASVAGVFHLEKDQQIFVTVTDTSLVNRDSCSFGLFKLR